RHVPASQGLDHRLAVHDDRRPVGAGVHGAAQVGRAPQAGCAAHPGPDPEAIVHGAGHTVDMRRWRRVWGWAAILVATSGCAAHSAHDRTAPADRNLLTQEDLREYRFATVFDAIEARSEEHTSELQSRGHLVCRLL